MVNFVLSKVKKIDGIVALGCLLKGETNHFETISKIVSEQLTILSIKYNKPITSGIVSANSKNKFYQEQTAAKRIGL